MKLKAKIIAFLHQRRKAAMILNAPEVQRISEKLLNQFDLIRDMDDWRHLREVYNQQAEFTKILPSPNGGHAEIRDHMLEIIAVANRLASKPRTINPDKYGIQSNHKAYYQSR